MHPERTAARRDFSDNAAGAAMPTAAEFRTELCITLMSVSRAWRILVRSPQFSPRRSCHSRCQFWRDVHFGHSEIRPTGPREARYYTAAAFCARLKPAGQRDEG